MLWRHIFTIYCQYLLKFTIYIQRCLWRFIINQMELKLFHLKKYKSNMQINDSIQIMHMYKYM